MLNSWLLLIISSWIMLWNKAVFCLEVLIYKRLQMWRHNDVIGRNEYLISTLSQCTVSWVYSLQFLFKSTHHTSRYERKCESVFFWTQCSITITWGLEFAKYGEWSKFGASFRLQNLKGFQLQGDSPPDKGLCSWTQLGAQLPDPWISGSARSPSVHPILFDLATPLSTFHAYR